MTTLPPVLHRTALQLRPIHVPSPPLPSRRSIEEVAPQLGKACVVRAAQAYAVAGSRDPRLMEALAQVREGRGGGCGSWETQNLGLGDRGP
jgi:hypothetical protein